MAAEKDPEVLRAKPGDHHEAWEHYFDVLKKEVDIIAGDLDIKCLFIPMTAALWVMIRTSYLLPLRL